MARSLGGWTLVRTCVKEGAVEIKNHGGDLVRRGHGRRTLRGGGRLKRDAEPIGAGCGGSGGGGAGDLSARGGRGLAPKSEPGAVVRCLLPCWCVQLGEACALGSGHRLTARRVRALATGHPLPPARWFLRVYYQPRKYRLSVVSGLSSFCVGSNVACTSKHRDGVFL